MSKYMLIVLSNAVDGRDAAFNAWYDGPHLNAVLRIPGFVGAKRFRTVGRPISADPLYRYCATYEVETNDPDSVLGDVQSRVGSSTLPMSDALAPQFYAVMYEML